MLTKLNGNYSCGNKNRFHHSILLNSWKKIQMHFLKLHGIQFNKCSYHAFSNYGVKWKITAKKQKCLNNLNCCLLGDTLHMKFQRILTFHPTIKYIFCNYGVILQIYEKIQTNKCLQNSARARHADTATLYATWTKTIQFSQNLKKL